MNRLKSRLKNRTSSKKNQANDLLEINTHSQLLEDIKNRKAKNISEPAVQNNQKTAYLQGELIQTEFGPLWVNETRWKNYSQGQIPLSKFLQTSSSLGDLAKDILISKANPQNALFIDTETTGLSKGTGTIPFLIGLGYFEGNDFVVLHLLCQEPAQEPAQLYLLSQKMAQADYLVSFNGKSFDIPLINTRFIINRVQNRGARLPHLDLLHVARNIFKKRLEKNTLQTLEKVILGFQREDDIPGSLIPQAYWDWLKGGSSHDIARILTHNAFDIISLAALCVVFENMYLNPEQVRHVSDHLGLAKVANIAQNQDRFDNHLGRVQNFGENEQKIIAMHMSAKNEMKLKNFSDASSLWNKILILSPNDQVAHLCLAKFYEHKEKNYEKALYHAKNCLEYENTSLAQQRIKRLEKKIEKICKTQRLFT